MKKTLFISVHPDDETLGCGGTIHKHKQQGDEIFWLILTKAYDSEKFIKNVTELQKEYINKVSAAYKFDKTVQLDFKTTELDNYPIGEIITGIGKVINELKPDIIYLPNRSDVHSDHKVAFNAAYSCTKSFRYPFINNVYMYETLSETEFAPPFVSEAFIPNVFVDITSFFTQKLEIMNLFHSEVMQKPFPRSLSSIEALARYRGSRAGVEFAEAFMLIYQKL